MDTSGDKLIWQTYLFSINSSEFSLKMDEGAIIKSIIVEKFFYRSKDNPKENKIVLKFMEIPCSYNIDGIENNVFSVFTLIKNSFENIIEGSSYIDDIFLKADVIRFNLLDVDDSPINFDNTTSCFIKLNVLLS